MFMNQQNASTASSAQRKVARPVPKTQNNPPKTWWKRGLWAALAGAVLVWAAPILVAHSPLLGWVVNSATADLQGSVTLGGASLGWFSPCVVDNLSIADDQGQPVASVSQFRSERTLLGLLLHLNSPGTFHVDRPVLHVKTTSNSSNLEQVFAAWLQPTEEAEDPLQSTPVQLEVSDAEVKFSDTAGRSWNMKGLNVSVAVPARWDENLTLKLAGSWAEANQPGHVKADLQFKKTPGQGLGTAGKLQADVAHLPLWVAEAVAKRWEPKLECAGEMHGRCDLVWGEGAKEQASLAGLVGVKKLKLAAPCLQGDRLELESVEVPCQLTWNQGQLAVTKLEAVADCGRVSLQGSVNTASEWQQMVRQAAWSVQAEVDVARLATLLPQTLSLRADTQMTGGRLQLQAHAQATQQETSWNAELKVSDLQALRQGQRLAWNEPLEVSLAAQQSATAAWPTVQKLVCKSSFLQLEASGSLDNCTATAQADLQRLGHELSQFMDLQGIQLDGQGWLQTQIARDEKGTAQWRSQVRLDRFRLAGWAGNELSEPQLDVACVGTVQFDGQTVKQLDGLHAQIHAGSEQIELKQLTPWLQPAASGPGATWNVWVRGDMARFLDRVKPFAPALAAWQVMGQTDVQATVSGSAELLEVVKVEGTVQQLQAIGPGLNLSEREMRFRGRGRYESGVGRLWLAETELQSSTLAVQTPTLELTMSPDGSLQLGGQVHFQTELAPLLGWFMAPSPDGAGLTGRAQGTVNLEPSHNHLHGQIQASVERFVVGDVRDPAWSESRVTLTGQVGYWLTQDKLDFQQVQVATPAARCDVAGQLDEVLGQQRLKVSGQLKLDWEKLSPQLRPYVGQDVRIVGQETRPFQLEGSLAALTAVPSAEPAAGPVGWAAMQGKAEVAWESAKVDHFLLGAGQPKILLQQGWLQVEPFEVLAHQGRLKLAPALRLEPEPMLLVHPKELVIDRVQLTPDICAGMLRYVAPVIAGATAAEGSFSLALDGAQLPLNDMQRGSLAGQLKIHTVKIRGTSLLFELIGQVLEGPPEAQLMSNSSVSFQMSDGRIHHRGARVTFPAMPGFWVETSGSVGMDQSLSLIAEMPIPPKWLAQAGPAAAALAQQTLKIPVGGTLMKPTVDVRSVQQAQQQVLRQAAGNALQQGVEKGLEKLFNPRR